MKETTINTRRALTGILFLLFTLALLPSSAQVTIHLQPDSSSKYQRIDDLWKITVSATTPLYLDAEITLYDEDDEDEIFYNGASEGFTIDNNTVFSFEGYPVSSLTEKVQFKIFLDVKGKKKSERQLPTGNYVLCASVYDHTTHTELSRECDYVRVRNYFLDSLIQAEKNKVPALGPSFHASLETFTYFDVQNASSLLVRHRNSGIHFSPSATIFGYPFTASFYYDTDTGYYYNSLPTFQFNLDADQYRTILEQRLNGKLQEKSGVSLDGETNAFALLAEQEQLQKVTDNPVFQYGSKYLDSLKVYETYLSDSGALVLINRKLQSLDTIDYTSALMDSTHADSSEIYLKAQHTRDSLLVLKDSIEHKIEAYSDMLQKAMEYKDILERKDIIDSLAAKDSTLSGAVKYYNEYKDFNTDTYTDPDFIRQKLENIDQIKKMESFMSGFNVLQIGATAPDYSEYSITGVLLNGIHINYSREKTDLLFVAGRINDNSTLFTLDRSQHTYSKLYTGGIKYSPAKNLEYGFYYLNSDFNDADTLSYFNFLEKNNALSNTLKYSFWKDHVTAEGEFALSYAQNSDLIAEPPSATHTFWIAQALAQKDHIENGSFTDKAGKLNLTATVGKNKTKLSLTSRYIGAGFYTPGNPFLLNDLFNIEAGFDQSLLKNAVQASFYVIRNRDNLDGSNEVTTSYYNFRASSRLSFKKLPLIAIDYLPNVIINDLDQVQVNTLTGTAMYQYKIGKVPCLVTATVVDVRSLSAVNDSSSYAGRYYTVLQSFNCKGFTINAGYNFNRTQDITQSLDYNTVTAGTTLTLFKKADINATIEAIRNGSEAINFGGQFDIVLRLLKNFSFEAGFYAFPQQNFEYITNTNGISSSSAYLLTTFNF